MIRTFTKSIAHCSQWIYRSLTAVISLVAAFSINVHADTLPDDDIYLWLQQEAPQNPKPDDGIYYSTGEFSTNFNSPSYALTTPDVKVNEHGFSKSNKKIAKSNEKKLLRRLSEKFKVTLFSAKSRRSKHRVYLNAAKQEIVSKSRLGKARYEIRITEKEAEAHFRYTF